MNTTAIRPANFTRRTRDLAGKLRREHRYGFLALYHLLRLSDLAREGIERSGSFRFADHLYANRASGRGWIGRALDRLLLSLPAARAMRRRCCEATEAMRSSFASHREVCAGTSFRVLTVPCGLPRDVRDFADSVNDTHACGGTQIEYTGIDLDPEVIIEARCFLNGSVLGAPRLLVGDALDADAYPTGGFHFIASTGLGEFLDDAQLVRFYGNVHRALAPGGVFFTSASARERRSDALLRAFELDTHYRSRCAFETLICSQPWTSVVCHQDATGLQTFVRARK